MNVYELLADAIESDDEGTIRWLVQAIKAMGETIEIVSEEPDHNEPDGIGRRQTVCSEQLHTIVWEGEEVAALVREGLGYYGDPDHPNTPSGEWTSDSGENDIQPTTGWIVACREIAPSNDTWDHYPEAPEPDAEEPETDPGGRYCLWWSTVGDDDGPRPHTRYPTLADAELALEEADLGLRCRNRGNLLCGYGIGELIEGEWRQVEQEED